MSMGRIAPCQREIEMSPGDGLWSLCETPQRVSQGAVASSTPQFFNDLAGVTSHAGSSKDQCASGMPHGPEERADVIHPQRRLLEGGEVPATRHRREVHDVEPRLGRLAARFEVRVRRRRAPIVL